MSSKPFIHDRTSLKEALYFFLLTFGLSYAVWIPALVLLKTSLIPQSITMPIFFAGSITPSIAAVILTLKREGSQKTKNLLKRCLQFKLGLWYIPMLLIAPVFFIVPHFINLLNGVPIPKIEALADPISIPLIFITQLATASLFEEYGWRGYALAKLQKNFNWVLSSLIVGSIWALWHLPSFLINGFPQFFMPYPQFFITLVLGSILITWIQNNTKGSLLPAFFIHAYLNASFEILPLMELKPNGDYTPWIISNLMMALTVLLLIAFKAVKKKSESSFM